MQEREIEAIENLAKAINGYTEEMKKQNPNRLLSIKEVAEEYGINERTVGRRIFNNPQVVTNRITKEKKIKNSELWKFFDIAHKED